jgi:type I restriction-modification system DNA methylase subunit/restriction endonuclease S subunit
MPIYTCEKCEKSFEKKTDFTRHTQRKISCVGQSLDEKVAAMVDTRVAEKVVEIIADLKHDVDQSSVIITLVKRLHNLMRTKDSMIGQKAFYDIIRLLLLRFIQPQLNPGGKLEDMMDTKHYANYIPDFEPQDINLLKFDELEKVVLSSDGDDRRAVINKLWDMLSGNTITVKIFPHGQSFNCNPETLGLCISIIKDTLTDAHFDELTTDVKGQIYELFINNYASNTGKEFGQFFTPRNLIHRIFELNQQLVPDQKVTSVYDPCAGTCGFLTEMIKSQKIDPENIHGGELEPDTFATGLMNLILSTGSTCQLRNHNSLTENSLQQYDWIATNPPFGVTTKYAELLESGQQKQAPLKKGQSQNKKQMSMSDMYPVKTNDGSALFLQHCMAKLKNNGLCNIVLPDGQLLSGKNFTKLRKYFVGEYILHAVLHVPGGAFEHAGVQTAVLFFGKSNKNCTGTVEFYETDKKCETITHLGSVAFDELPETSKYELTWSAHKPRESLHIIDSDWEIKELGDVCEFVNGKKHNVSEGSDDGKYPLVCSSTKGKVKYLETYDYEQQYICVGTGGSANVGLFDHFSVSTHTKVLNTTEEVLLKYLYFYLKTNLDLLDFMFTGTALKNLDLDQFKTMQIPIPSIAKQQEIIRRCERYESNINQFTTRNNDLENDLSIMKELYIYPLFKGDVQSLGDLCEMKSGKFNSSSIATDGKYPFYSGKAINPSGMHNDYCFDYEQYLILTKDGGAGKEKYGDQIGLGKVFLVNGKTAATSHQFALIPKNTIMVKYLFYYLTSIKNNIMDLAKYTTGLGCISKESIASIQVPVPSLAVQQEIIDKYEKMYSVINQNKENMQLIEKNKKEYLDQYFKFVNE